MRYIHSPQVVYPPPDQKGGEKNDERSISDHAEPQF